ncbi:MAG: hypothetical protein IJY24_02070 [Clostridia bacterium]|nr:hypothetical protein [Clostridia bacterium]
MFDLKDLLKQYPELAKKHSADRLRGFLNDLNPGDKAHNTIIIALLQYGFVDEMRDTAPAEISVSYYCQRMENELGFSPDRTAECVELWADALGYADRLSKVSIVTPGGIKISYESQDISRALIATGEYKVELNTLLCDTDGVAYLELWAGNGSGKAVDVYLHGFTLDGKADKEFINLGTIKAGEGDYLYLPLGKPARAEDHNAAFTVVIDDKALSISESGRVSVSFNCAGHRFAASVA